VVAHRAADLRVFAARPEIVFRAEKQDLPAIAKALFERSSRK
jgi:hypothetical protein